MSLEKKVVQAYEGAVVGVKWNRDGLSSVIAREDVNHVFVCCLHLYHFMELKGHISGFTCGGSWYDLIDSGVFEFVEVTS